MRKPNLTILALVGLIVFSSCDSSKVGPVVSSDPSSPTITDPSANESFTLTEETTEDTLTTVKWTKPDFGFDVAADFLVEMDLQGNNFSSPVLIGSTNKTSLPIVVEKMNNLLLANGMQGGQPAPIELRVTAAVNDSLEPEVSEPVPVSVTPFEVEISFPEVYVPGSYQAAGNYGSNWTPEDAPPLASPDSDDRYLGYVFFNDANTEFKFTDERNWDLNWGDDGADGTLDQNGANIAAANSGFYFINVDLNDMTYTLENTTWGVIGSATADGWDADQDMTYDVTDQVWRITLDLTAEEMKFRANDAWDINYGDTGADGELERDGDNIAIDEAGNYTIELDFSNPPVFTFSLTLN